MSPREIPRSDWPTFLEEFSRVHRGWLATIESTAPGYPPRVEAVERSFRSVTPILRADHIEHIEIRFHEDARPRDVVRIDGPVSVCVEETATGTARGLELVDESGTRTRIRFRTAPTSDTLDGIAPGELAQE
jgi:hypothetical protein